MATEPTPPVSDQLLNLDESIPGIFYIFVNKFNPITAHNFTFTGSFSSAGVMTAAVSEEGLRAYMAGELNFVPYYPRDMGALALSPFFVSATNDYSVEYDADYWRNLINPIYPSRLSALYAFGDYESCVEVSEKHGWPLDQLHRFRLKPSILTRVVKVNMEIVSLMRTAKRISMLSAYDTETAWRHYWSAAGDLSIELPGADFKRRSFNSGVIWEYLIEGVAEVVAD